MNTDMETTQLDASVTGFGKAVKKKTGRKPSKLSPTLRKAQNRAAQQAFRQRKQQYISDLELDYKRLLNERDTNCKKVKQLGKENDILKCENWYLKGIVLSLQLVCFKSKLCIPKHTPHMDDHALQIMAKSAPTAVATYIDVNSRYPSPILNNKPVDYSIRSSIPNDDNETNHDENQTSTATLSSDQADKIHFHNFRQNSTEHASTITPNTNETIKLQPVLLRHGTVMNNLAAIQSLRIRLRLQSALFRENSVLHSITPTPLQQSVPHDPRIDLIPTPHMRDRMIIFQDQFDLDDCLRLLVNEAFFTGDDPTVAGNWALPTSFYEKYWFLTIDYTHERTSKQWKQPKAKNINIRSTVSHDHPHQQQQPLYDIDHHRQSTSPPLYSSTTPHNTYVQQSTNTDNYDPTTDPFGFIQLQDNNAILCQGGEALDSTPQTPSNQPQQSLWTQPFPLTIHDGKWN